ncbi:MAG: type II CRISPR RNA-guided endonuclease Cas9, partial [Longicatena sp.]
MTKLKKDYSIGLDIGDASVGWAVVDDDYSLLKHKDKNMWGARLFEPGESAVNRRVARSTRRRIQRRKVRISLLKELVGNMVLKQDVNFFMRMEKGYQTKDDKGYNYNLFIEESFNDQKYYDDYKTIYHLRKHLCSTQQKADPRLIYLALHHIIKYRGNFLYEGQKFEISDSRQAENDLKEALSLIVNKNEFSIDLNEVFVQELLNILMNQKEKRGLKRDRCIALLLQQDSDCKKVLYEVIGIMLGYDANLTRMFPVVNIQKDEKDFKTNFSSTKYEDDLDFIETSLSEDFETISLLHNVYSYLVLQGVMDGEKLLCDAMIKNYGTHKKDLEELKYFIKKYYDLSIYRKIFRDKKIDGNYYGYINNPRKTGKKEFYDYLKKQLATNEEAMTTETYLNIMNKIEMDKYLPKQNSKDNGAIPYQLHEVELLKILENQGKYYPELQENKEKIMSVFRFRVPYYVGPLNSHSEFNWCVRKEDGAIKPWNFDEKIDKISSAQNFIRRMTNCCTYLLTQPVVPKKSLLYARYEVLNELNKIRINGKLMDQEIKHQIINELFLERKKIKSSDIRLFYERKQLACKDAKFEITGFQKEDEFATSLESWIDFKEIYGDNFDSHLDEIEKIIEWITVYEDKKILKARIENEVVGLSQKQISMILKKRYKGWGRFSEKLLKGLHTLDEFGNSVSIMDCLEHTNLNFMQIINDKKLKFDKLINKENMADSNDGKISYDVIERLQGSPAIKKGIWQTIKIVEELNKVMGHAPKNIYIEFARSDEQKKRTVSKVKKLQDIYNNIKKDNKSNAEFMHVYEELFKEDKSSSLDNERLYLYYVQQGKCLYSGKPLEISMLNTYQVDHIIPQSYIKDDSFENKALVYSNENQYKGDNLILAKDIRHNRYDWWKKLHDNGLIGSKKFNNLIRPVINERDEIGFINRQLVETRQITKHVANLFKNMYPETTVVSIKASLSHDFREKYQLYKVREINDYHHAQDAYLSCILGTYVL